MLRKLRYPLYVATAAFWLLCAIITHLPVSPGLTPPGNDKIKHIAGYGALAGMLYVSLWAAGGKRMRVPILVLLILAAYGAVDELTQPPFGRTADIYDWIADVAGTALACGGLTLVRSAFAPRPK